MIVGNTHTPLSMIGKTTSRSTRKQKNNKMGEKNTLDLDIYKTFHTIAEYSFLSSANGTFLQDRPHISLNKFNRVEIIRRMFSDHSRISFSQ